MHRAPVAQTLACRSCGGAIPLEGLAPRVRCAYCGATQDVPPEKLAELAQYQRSAGELALRIRGEDQQRAAWEVGYGQNGKPRAGGYIAPLAIFGGMAAIYGVSMALLRARVIDEADLERILPVGILGFFFLAMGGVIAWNVSRKRRASTAPARVVARCPRCGAPLAFDAGKISERCAHCDAALIAGTAIQREAIDVARADLRRAAMARYRVERSAMVGIHRASFASVMPYYVLGSFLLLTMGSALSFTVDSLTTARSDTPASGLAFLWLLVLGNAGAIVAVAIYRARRQARWRSVAETAAARMDGGRALATAAEWVGWLNALWAGPYAAASLLVGPCFHACVGGVGGFPVAFDIQPLAGGSPSTRRRADVLVAASLPGGAEALPIPVDIVRRATALGFAPTSCSGGFVAESRGALTSIQRGDSAAAAELLSTAAALLIEWARRAGATPAAPS